MKLIAKGKVRDIYDLGYALVIVTTDRVSAFDSVLPNIIPYKGVVLNRISEFWFNHTLGITKNHVISTNNMDMPEFFRTKEFEGRCMLVKKLQMLPVECIVRGYITGSGWESYLDNGCVCGIKLPAGLKESEKLPFPIFTPTTKATEGHDEHVSYDEVSHLIGRKNALQIKEKSIQIYKFCSEYAKEKGIIIADTKLEWGIDKDGSLTLADEVLTPDSSRFWSAKDYVVGKSQKSFDKQYLRDYLVSSGWDKMPPAPLLPDDVVSITSEKYITAYETLTGLTF